MIAMDAEDRNRDIVVRILIIHCLKPTGKDWGIIIINIQHVKTSENVLVNLIWDSSFKVWVKGRQGIIFTKPVSGRHLR